MPGCRAIFTGYVLQQQYRTRTVLSYVFVIPWPLAIPLGGMFSYWRDRATTAPTVTFLVKHALGRCDSASVKSKKVPGAFSLLCGRGVFWTTTSISGVFAPWGDTKNPRKHTHLLTQQQQAAVAGVGDVATSPAAPASRQGWLVVSVLLLRNTCSYPFVSIPV